jgi:hypothetical protein
MDVSALTLVTMPTGTEETAPAPSAATGIDGAAFAKLLSGLGAAALPPGTDAAPPVDRLAAADQPGEGAPPPADPALLLQALRIAPAAARPKGEASAAAPDAREEHAAAADGEAPTTDSLGLPPLLAALVAPTLAQAAPVVVAPAQGDGAPPAPPAPTGAALPAVTPAPVGAAALPAMPSPPIELAAVPAAATGSRPAPAAAPADAAVAAAAAVAVPAVALPATARAAGGRSMPAEIAADATHLPPAAAGTAPPPLAAGVPAPRRAPTPDGTVAADAPSPSELPAKPDQAVETAVPLAPRPPAVVAAPAALADPAAPVSVAAARDAAPVAQPLIEHQLDMAREGEWLDQLTRDIVRTAASEGSLRFRLNPEHLGSLEVEVTQGQAGTSVRLTADTEQARSLLADARPQLIAEARAQGVRIAEAHVDLGGQSEGPGGQSAAQSQAGNGGRSGRDVPAQEYLTSWQPESVEEEPSRSRRSSAERYA